MSAAEFDVAALAARLVERDLDGEITPADVEHIGMDAMLPYYAQAHAILAAMPLRDKQ